MINTMGLILTGGKNSRLKELSLERSISAVPYGGKFRAIDFVLSNLVNSNITNIGILTQYNFRSLMDHLGSGKEWDLDRKNDGLFVFPPYLSESNTGWYNGTADAMYNNLTFLKRSDEEFVLIAQGHSIYKMNFEPLIRHHIEKDADITVACRYMEDFPESELIHLGIIDKDSDDRIIDFQEKPLTPKTNIASLGIYIIKRKLLISLLEDSAAHGYTDFVKDILIKNLNDLRIYSYEFKGYWRPLSTIKLYYQTNMDLLNPDIRNELFLQKGKVYTKVKDSSPTKYNIDANVKNSIVADGCIIEGSVENSIIFRDAVIKKGAQVKNSIVMQNTTIHENAMVEYAIMDKNVNITSHKNLKGDCNWPIIVSKGVSV